MSLLLLTRSPVSAHASGVLKVWDSTTSTWRKIGCDGAAPFADDFGRSDRSLSGDNGWAAGTGTMQIVSGLARWTAPGPYLFATLYRPGSPTSGTYSVDKGSNVNAWLMLRHDQTTGTFLIVRGDAAYQWDPSSGFVLIAGSIDTFPLSGTSGAGTISVTITGNVFAVSQAGVSVGSFIYAPYATGPGEVGLYVSDAAATLDNFTITEPGRLRMQLPDGSWVREACDADTLERHPLKIEDPANPGSWVIVACMVPAEGLYSSATYDTARYG